MPLLRLANRQDGRVSHRRGPGPGGMRERGLVLGRRSRPGAAGRALSYVAALVREAFSLFHELLGLAMPPAAYAQLAPRPLPADTDLARAAKAGRRH